MPRCRSGRLEPDVGRAETDDVAFVQTLLTGDSYPVDECAIRRIQVDHDVLAGRLAHLGVLAADVAVVDRDRAFGEAADGDGALVEADPLAGRQHDRRHRRSAGT